MAVNDFLNKAYVTNYNDDTVSVINLDTNIVTGTVSVGNGPWEITADIVNSKVYVVNYLAGTVSIIDSTNDTVVATLSVGLGPLVAEINTTTQRLYVSNSLSDTISVFNMSSNPPNLVSTIVLSGGSVPHGLAINRALNQMYVNCKGNSTLLQYTLSNNSAINSLLIGQAEEIFHDNGYIYVPEVYSNRMTIIYAGNSYMTDASYSPATLAYPIQAAKINNAIYLNCRDGIQKITPVSTLTVGISRTLNTGCDTNIAGGFAVGAINEQNRIFRLCTNPSGPSTLNIIGALT